jgi:hypothetical protein
VSDRQLLQAYYGEDDASKESHVRTCLRCAGRLQRLTRDLHAIEHALRGALPVAAVRDRAAAHWRGVAVAAALAAVVVFGGVEAWLWRESIIWVQPKPDHDPAETLAFLEQVSMVLSSTGEEGNALGAVLALPSEDADEPGAGEAEWLDGEEEGQ